MPVAAQKPASAAAGIAAAGAAEQASVVPTPVLPVTKPDDAHYDSLIKVETDAIEGLRKRINEITEEINSQGSSFEDFTRQRTALRKSIDEITEKINRLVEERDQRIERSAAATQHGRNLRNQMDTMQRNLGFHTAAEIDQRIQEIKHEIMVSTMPLNQEKKLLVQIDKLLMAKPELAKIAELGERAEFAESAGQMSNKEQLTKLRDELNTLRDGKQDLQTKLRDLIDERTRQQAPLLDMREKRDELRRKMWSHQAQVSQLQSERRAKETAYRAYQATIRASQFEAKRWENQMSQLEADIRAVQQDLSQIGQGSYDWKSVLAAQVIAYLEDQMKSTDSKTKATDSQAAADSGGEPTTIETNDGTFTIHTRKKMEPSSGRLKKKKSKQNRKAEPRQPTDKIQLTFSTINDFSQLGFDGYPMTVAECPQAIAKLEKMIQDINMKNSSKEEASSIKRTQLETRLKDLEEKVAALNAKQPESMTSKKKP